jgi:hypothetical protein
MDPITSTCRCPLGYERIPAAGAWTDATTKCRPMLPREALTAKAAPTPVLATVQNEMFLNADGYPVCGAGRIPAKYSQRVPEFAANDVPNSSSTVAGPLFPAPYPFARVAVAPAPPANFFIPHYLNWDYTHCACVRGHNVTSVATGTNVNELDEVSVGGPRLLPDTLEAIASRGNDLKPNRRYGQLAIARDNGAANDGRLGTIYSAGGDAGSECGCPNVNERPVRLNPADPQSGYACVTRLTGTPDSIMLSKFSRTAHAGTVGNYVIDATSEVRDAGGNIIEKIRVPANPDTAVVTAPATLPVYERGIWVCAPGFSLDLTTGACAFQASHNACDGSSEVSPAVSGTSYQNRFENTVNKKLGCCGFQFGRTGASGATPIKMDCVANDTANYATFDALWASQDAVADGGQPNLLVLTDRGGRELTGWYRLDGRRCGQYASISKDPVFRGKVVPPLVNTQQGAPTTAGDLNQPNGLGTITRPTGTNDYIAKLESSAAIRTRLGNPTHPGNGIQAARTDAALAREAFECPIYVRAAAVYGCDENAKGATQLRTLIDGGNRRCAAAATTQIHFRVEQIYEIYGQKSIPTQDSIVNSDQVRTITIQDLWEVNGFGTCPRPAVRNGESCIW